MNVVTLKFGSHLYGTSTPNSDLDFKGIFLPTAREILLHEQKAHYSNDTADATRQNTKDDVDREYFSLKHFIDMACNGEMIAMDMLHAPDSMIVEQGNPAIWSFLRRHRSKFYTTEMSTFIDYVRRQASKYGIKGSRMNALKEIMDIVMPFKGVKAKVEVVRDVLPVNEFCYWVRDERQKVGFQDFYVILGRKFQTSAPLAEMVKVVAKIWTEYGERVRQAADNKGIDWKAVSHAIRAGYQLKEIYTTGDLKFPLANAEGIKRVKMGEISWAVAQQVLEDLVSDLESIVAKAELAGYRTEVDRTFWDDFVLEVHADIVKRGA